MRVSQYFGLPVRGAVVEFCAFALLYQPCPGDNIDCVPTVSCVPYAIDRWGRYPLAIRPFYTMPCPENPLLSNRCAVSRL
jgi:hypothetical protein